MLGSALGSLFAGMINKAYGWRDIYYIYGIIGLIWCTVWFMYNKFIFIDFVNQIQKMINL